MEFTKLSQSVDCLLQRLKELENQVDYLRQRESNLLAANKNLHLQIEQAQEKIQLTISRLKLLEEQS